MAHRLGSSPPPHTLHRALSTTPPQQGHPEPALYNGGILRWAKKIKDFRTADEGNYSPSFVLYNMSAATVYSFSCESP
jgi:hypothetical protein